MPATKKPAGTTEEIEASEPAPDEHAPHRIERPRRCAVCDTALSGYNEGPHCWRHSVGMPWRGPSAKPKFD